MWNQRRGPGITLESSRIEGGNIRKIEVPLFSNCLIIAYLPLTGALLKISFLWGKTH